MPYFMSYEEWREWRVKQYEDSKRAFKENFPTVYVIIHTLVLSALAIAVIAIQIALLVNNAYFASISNGIWVGAFVFVVVLVLIILSKTFY